MKKDIRHILLSIAVVFLILFPYGCKTGSESAIQDASRMIREGRAECVLIRSGKIAYVEKGHGVSPLLHLYDTHKDEMKDAVLVDKVIGRAAAAIAICGQVKHVHAEVMSEDAVLFLKSHGITSSQNLLVPRILNRSRTGLCPLEKSVEGTADPAQALILLRRKIAQMQKKSH